MGKIFGYLAVLLFVASCSVVSDEPRSGPTLAFHITPKSSQKLLLFVHGIFGDPASTWTNHNGESWMDLLGDDPDFRDFTVATIRYDTPLLTRASTIEEAATRVLRRLQDEGVFRKYNEIYFIAHSMGGLLVKRMLVDLNRSTQPESFRRVKAVLYISTPAQGTNLADLGSWLSINPQLRDMREADLNSFMQSLENDWQNLIRGRDSRRLPRTYCAYETKPTYGTIVVNRLYAATICDENPIAIDENHFTIVKPLNRQADIYVWARARIQDAAGAPPQRGIEDQLAGASTAIFMECQILPIQVTIKPQSSINVIAINKKRMEGQNWGFHQITNNGEKETLWPNQKAMDESRKKKNFGEMNYRCEVSNHGSQNIVYLALPIDFWIGNNKNAVKYRPIVSGLSPRESFSFYIINDCPINVAAAWQEVARVQMLGDSSQRDIPLRRKFKNPAEQLMFFFPTSVRWVGDHACE